MGRYQFVLHPHRRRIWQATLAVIFGIAVGAVHIVDWTKLPHLADSAHSWLASLDPHESARNGLSAALRRLAGRQAELDEAVVALAQAMDQVDEAVVAKRAVAAAHQATVLLEAEREVESWEAKLARLNGRAPAAPTQPVAVDFETVLKRTADASLAKALEQYQAVQSRQTAGEQEAVAQRARAEAADTRAAGLAGEVAEMQKSLIVLREQHSRQLQDALQQTEQAQQAADEARRQSELASHQAEVANGQAEDVRRQAAESEQKRADSTAEAERLRAQLDVIKHPPIATETKTPPVSTTKPPLDARARWEKLLSSRSTRQSLDGKAIEELLGRPTYVAQTRSQLLWVYRYRGLGQGIVQFGRDGLVSHISPPAAVTWVERR